MAPHEGDEPVIDLDGVTDPEDTPDGDAPRRSRRAAVRRALTRPWPRPLIAATAAVLAAAGTSALFHSAQPEGEPRPQESVWVPTPDRVVGADEWTVVLEGDGYTVIEPRDQAAASLGIEANAKLDPAGGEVVFSATGPANASGLSDVLPAGEYEMHVACASGDAATLPVQILTSENEPLAGFFPACGLDADESARFTLDHDAAVYAVPYHDGSPLPAYAFWIIRAD